MRDLFLLSPYEVPLILTPFGAEISLCFWGVSNKCAGVVCLCRICALISCFVLFDFFGVFVRVWPSFSGGRAPKWAPPSNT